MKQLYLGFHIPWIVNCHNDACMEEVCWRSFPIYIYHDEYEVACSSIIYVCEWTVQYSHALPAIISIFMMTTILNYKHSKFTF